MAVLSAPLGVYYGVQSGIAAYDAFSEGNWRDGSKRLVDTVDIAVGFTSFAKNRRILKALAGPVKSAPKRRLLDDAARFAQRDYSEVFGAKGIKIYSDLAGKRIVTIDDLAYAVRSGAVHPSKLPIDVIRRGQTTLILNTRTSEALRRAGIPRSQWNSINRTGDDFFESLLNGQLRRNHLDDFGIPDPRSQGFGL